MSWTSVLKFSVINSAMAGAGKQILLTCVFPILNPAPLCFTGTVVPRAGIHWILGWKPCCFQGGVVWEMDWPSASNLTASLCLRLKLNLVIVRTVCLWLVEWSLKSCLQWELKCYTKYQTDLYPARLSTEWSSSSFYVLHHPVISEYEKEKFSQLQSCEVGFLWMIQDLSVAYSKCAACLAWRLMNMRVWERHALSHKDIILYWV